MGRRESIEHTRVCCCVDLRVLYTHFAATYYGPEVACLQGLFLRPLELAPVLDHRHPKADLVRVIMAVFFVTFDERRRPEVLQTGPGTGQRLASALCTGARVLPRENSSNRVSFTDIHFVKRGKDSKEELRRKVKIWKEVLKNISLNVKK